MKRNHPKRSAQAKIHIGANLNVAIFKEGRTFVAFAPALDLVAQGKSIAEARKRFEEVFDIYLEETLAKGTLEMDLMRCGWHKREGNLQPPMMSTFPSDTLGKDITLKALVIVPFTKKTFACPA